MEPAIDVVVVNWNTGGQLRACLAALSASLQEGFRFGRVVVVDNASADHSADDLACPALPLVVIQNDTNRGFGAACNQGAAGSVADYLLFLNPDARVLEDTLSKSIRWMELSEGSRTGITGVQLLGEKGEVSRNCARFLATRYFVYNMLGLNRLFPKTFPDITYSEWNHLESRTIEHVMGAYFLIRSSLFLEVGGFDERFFVYLEDVDLSLRVRNAGWSSYYLATAQCYHSGCGSSNQIKARRLFYALRSRIFYGFKHFGALNAIGLLLMTLLIEPVTRVARAILHGSLAEIREVAQAYLLLWGALPSILGNHYLRKAQAQKLNFEVLPR